MDVRPDSEILDAYENNRDISRDECRLLYGLVDYGLGIGTFTKAVKDRYPHII